MKRLKYGIFISVLAYALVWAGPTLGDTVGVSQSGPAVIPSGGGQTVSATSSAVGDKQTNLATPANPAGGIVQNSSPATTGGNNQSSTVTSDSSSEANGAINQTKETAATVQKITLDQAVELTLANNFDLKLLEKQVDARTLDLDRADFFSGKLRDVDKKINNGWKEYNSQKSQFEAAKAAGILTPAQIAAMESQMSAAEEELRANSEYEIDSLADAQVTELFQIKAGLGLEVTQVGYQIARQKYALLTRQKYYEVLKSQRLVAVKKAAVTRAATQAKMAADSFQAGFRAKDDMLMAQAQLSLMRADLRKAENDLQLAVIDLKKVMTMGMGEEIKLVDDFSTDRSPVDFQAGLKQALESRLEIKKAEMELSVARVNMELAKSYATPNTFDYRQIKLDLDNAELALLQQRQSVEADVYGSYSTVIATGTMLDQVTDSVRDAREALEIATYRYKEGYGIPTSVLKSFSMEDAGGTIFEVLAAQEKLSEVEEKVVEITYGYNLAKSKYAVDTMKSE